MTSAALLLLLAAGTLLCCFNITPAFARESCDCISYSVTPVPRRGIKKVEMIPPAGHCRRTEIIVTMKSGKVFCTKPGTRWIDELFRNLQERELNSRSTGSTGSIGSTSTEPHV
ncbi:permeability factor 2 [Betta splendens]|uniref:Permeability factor 2 n=1 Tax=Betta splendens TaxID=158456 RepID=A0A8M1HHS2_BETSP|nr:permeability factor 2 [Betta splendens]